MVELNDLTYFSTATDHWDKMKIIPLGVQAEGLFLIPGMNLFFFKVVGGGGVQDKNDLNPTCFPLDSGRAVLCLRGPVI